MRASILRVLAKEVFRDASLYDILFDVHECHRPQRYRLQSADHCVRSKSMAGRCAMCVPVCFTIETAAGAIGASTGKLVQANEWLNECYLL